MYNWLIFQYHHVRVHSKFKLLKGCLPFGERRTDPLLGGKQ